MRLRKKPWSQEMFDLHEDIIVNEKNTLKGNWKNTLGVDTLRLEIGSGRGDYWHGLAQQFSNQGIIAMEKDFTAASIALKKLKEKNNKRLIHDDAKNLDIYFAEGELDAIHMNFSDPWPKTRHEKRRLTHASKCKIYHRLLNDEGRLIFKTDNRALFEYSLVSVTGREFELEAVWLDFRSTDDADPFTEYERKFIEKGQPIYRAIWRKVNVK